MTRNRSLAVACVILNIFSFVFSFLCFKTYDEQSIVGPEAYISIDTETKPINPNLVWSSLRSFAQERGLDIAVLKDDPENPDGRQLLYVIHGQKGESAAAQWLSQGYPWFSRDVQRVVFDASSLPKGQDPRIQYYVFGSERDAQAVAKFFAGLGLTGYTDRAFSVEHALQFFLAGNMLWCLTLSLLMSMLLIACGILFDAKRYCVQRLNGYGLARICFEEVYGRINK